MIGGEKKYYAHKLIQTRIVEEGDESPDIGEVFFLVSGANTTNSDPYYYVGKTGQVGFFIHADIINERELLRVKKKIKDNYGNNVIALQKD